MKEYAMGMEGLIKKCRDGERLAQEKMYKVFYGYAMGVALRYSNSREEAMEVVNDSFLKLFVQFTNGKKIGFLKPWLRKIVIHTAIDRFRREKNRIVGMEIVHADSKSDTYSIIDMLSKREIIQVVQKLSPGYRMVFNLYVLDGYSHKEIAEKLNIGVSTSKTNLRKAKVRLKTLLLKFDSERFGQYG